VAAVEAALPMLPGDVGAHRRAAVE
jgi:hypothetical protein